MGDGVRGLGEREKELGGAGKKEKQAQGDAHSSSHGECQSKQYFSLGQEPAEHQRSASAHYVQYNEGGMELMMMVIRMMAVLCELFHLQSCLLKYIQLSSVDQFMLPRHHWAIRSVLHFVQHCSRAEYKHKLPGSAVNQSHEPSHQYCTCSPYGSSDDTVAFFLSLIVLSGPYSVTYTSYLNNRNKWWQILVIPFPHLSLTPLSFTFSPRSHS